MKIKTYRAKPLGCDYWLTGSYFCFQESTPYPIYSEEQYIRNVHCIVYYEPGDWGLPGKASMREIDISTLEECPNLEKDLDLKKESEWNKKCEEIAKNRNSQNQD